MDTLALWVQLEAKPGKEQEVEQFLKSAQPLAEREQGTTTWFAIKMGPSKFGIFDTFADEKSRDAHMNGEIAKALLAKHKTCSPRSRRSINRRSSRRRLPGPEGLPGRGSENRRHLYECRRAYC